MRNAKDYGKYVYHLELNTTTYYNERKAKTNTDWTLILAPNRNKPK